MDKAPARTLAKSKKSSRRGRSRPSHLPDGGLHIDRLNGVLLVLAILAIGGGFVFLASGSTTVSAILLVGGYLGLVPWAILVKGGSRASEPDGAKELGSLPKRFIE